MNLSEKLRNSVFEKYIYREGNVKKIKIEDVCVSMDDLHEIESVQHCA